MHFLIALLLPWIKRQLWQSLQWILFSKVVTIEQHLTNKLIHWIKLNVWSKRAVLKSFIDSLFSSLSFHIQYVFGKGFQLLSVILFKIFK